MSTKRVLLAILAAVPEAQLRRRLEVLMADQRVSASQALSLFRDVVREHHRQEEQHDPSPAAP